MMGKNFRIGILIALAALVGGSTVKALDSPDKLEKIERQRRYQRSGVTERWEQYREKYLDINNLPPNEDGPGSFGDLHRSVVDELRTGGSLLSVMDADTIF